MELIDILEIDDQSQPRWMECPGLPGFAILVRLPDVPGLRALAMQASYEIQVKVKKAAAAAAATDGDIPTAEIDPGAVSVKWIQFGVQDWRGLTGEGLNYFLAGVSGFKLKTAADTPIPFQRDLLDVLIRHSVRFYEFADQAWKQRQQSDMEVRQTDAKNSLSVPDSTPTPNGVPGAHTTTSRSKRRSSATGAKVPSGEPQTS